MKRGDRVTVRVDGLSPGGDGLAVCEGRSVVVPHAVTGDRVDVRLRGRRKGRYEAVVEELLEPGVRRQDPACVHFGLCGGCRWQDLPYADQLRLKEEMVRNAIDRRAIAVRDWRPILPSPDTAYYRNKMEFTFGVGPDGELQLGLHPRECYSRVFDLESCVLQSAVSNAIVDSVRTHATRLRAQPYDLRNHEGLLRFLVLRDAKSTRQTMVNLVVSQYPNESVDRLLAAVIDEMGDDITTCLVTRHSGKAQAATGEREFLAKGTGRIVEDCGGIEFEISPRSFFQTNPRGAALLYRIVRDLAGDLSTSKVLDLYCGSGGVSLHLGQVAHRVVGIEQVSEAIDDARRNASRNRIGNCTFVAGQVETTLAQVGDLGGGGFDLIVVDPPRAGVHKKALASLLGLNPPRVIYVSCNPESLAADLQALGSGGYEVDCVQPLDLFPHTAHCEVVALLLRSPGPMPVVVGGLRG